MRPLAQQTLSEVSTKISPILLFGTKLGGRSFDLRHGGLHTCSISLSSSVILTGGSDYESIVHNAVDRSEVNEGKFVFYDTIPKVWLLC